MLLSANLTRLGSKLILPMSASHHQFHSSLVQGVVHFNQPEIAKKPLNSYFRFLRDQIDSVKSSNPNLAPTELYSLLAKIWRNLPKVEKQRYKDATVMEMAAWKEKRMHAQLAQVDDMAEALKKARSEKRRLEELAGKPQHPPSSFVLFRAETFRSRPSMSLYMCVQEWKDLSKVQKKEYAAKALKRRKSYAEEMSAWTDKIKNSQVGENLEKKAEEVKKLKKRFGQTLSYSSELPKRPISPFIRFSCDQFSSIQSADHHMKSRELVPLWAEKWKTLSKVEKQSYYDDSRKEMTIWTEKKDAQLDKRVIRVSKSLKKVRSEKRMVEELTRKPKMPPFSPFSLFTSEVSKDRPNMTFEMIGKEWKALTVAQKNEYSLKSFKQWESYVQERTYWTAKIKSTIIAKELGSKKKELLALKKERKKIMDVLKNSQPSKES